VAVTFAIAILPLLCSAGIAVDYSRAITARTILQSAVDGVALKLSREAASLSPSELKQRARSDLLVMLGESDIRSVDVATIYIANPPSLSIATSGSLDTAFMNILGFRKMDIDAEAMVAWGDKGKMQIALALDNTGSMSSSGKIAALRTAAHNLLDQLEEMSESEEVEVAIIPFANAVNVGTGNIAQTWLNWEYYNTAGNWTVSSGNVSGAGLDKSAWQGCVMDRDQPHDVKATTPSAFTKATLFPAIRTNKCPAALSPLTSNWVALHNLVDKMSASGTSPLAGTNQTIGLSWAWQALTQGAPLNAPAPGDDSLRIIVLMSDGLNTDNRWSGDTASVDARTKLACSNAKAEGIILYTVQVNTDNAPTSNLLKQCASEPKMFYLAKSASETISVFASIGSSLLNVRLSQ
jgi:Mg-chelatase subunit ChlD